MLSPHAHTAGCISFACRSRRSYPGKVYLRANQSYPLLVAADQHLNSSVARELRVAVCARLYLRRRYSRLDERATHGAGATFAYVLVSRILEAIDSDSERRILFDVGRDLGHLAHFGRLKVRPVGIEP